MTDWKVGDKVKICRCGKKTVVDTIAEITKNGKIRLTYSSELYNSIGAACGVWADRPYIYKITDEAYNSYIIKFKAMKKKIIEKLTSIKDSELSNYGSTIDAIYNKLIEDKPQ